MLAAVRVLRSTPGSPPAWGGYLLAGSGLIACYYLIPPFGVPSAFQVAIYVGISASASACLVIGMFRYRLTYRCAWWWVAAGQMASALADLMFFASHLVLGDVTFPSVADVLYLMEYPAVAVGLTLLIRRRTPGWDMASVLDASIIAVSVGMLSWIYLISPAAGARGLSVAGQLVAGAYPVGDLLLLAVAVRLMLGAGARTPAFHLVVGFLVLLLGVDTAYGIESVMGVYQAGGHLDWAWMASGLMLGAAGLHPSIQQLSERSPVVAPDATTGRLTVLAVASVLPPVIQIIQYARGAPLAVPLVSAVCIILFLLVLIRMMGLVAAQRRMAITDCLTGLYTRRYFEEVLNSEAERVGRGSTGLGVLLLDVDHFKCVNDTYGHHAGDRVLVEIALRLDAVTRAGDVAARYGGEEFIMLLPDTDPGELATIGERVCFAIAGAPIAVNETRYLSITVSVGAAAMPHHAAHPTDLALTVDRALYAAKETGRNRLVIAPCRDTVPPTMVPHAASQAR